MKTILKNSDIAGQNIKVGNNVWVASETPDGCIIWTKSRINFFGRRISGSKIVAYATPHFNKENVVEVEIHPDITSMNDDNVLRSTFTLAGKDVKVDRMYYILKVTNLLSIIKDND